MSSTMFDPWKTYHETPAEQAAIKARAKYREAMKEEYRRIKTNPLRPPPGVIVGHSETVYMNLFLMNKYFH